MGVDCMALLEWQDQFSVGVADLDTEHKNLVGMLNSLHDSMKAGKGRERLPQLLGEMMRYTATHFEHEEQLMAQYEYPGLGTHRQAHALLKDQIGQMQGRLDNKSLNAQEVLSLLKEWLVNHIGSEDLQYGPFLAEAIRQR